MPALPELQSRLAAHILLGVATPEGAVPQDGLLRQPERLLVHQRHVRNSLTAALRARYPALVKLVGDGFFAFCAAQFIAAAPPTDPRVARYGNGLPDFLAGFEPARAYPWLPDVARIESAACAVAEAPLVTPLASDALMQIPAGRAADVVFAWNPAVRLFASDLPAALVWRIARESRVVAQPDLAQGGPTRLMLRRTGDSVEAQDLRAADFALRETVAQGLPLGVAAERALGVDQDGGFDLAASLRALLDDGCVTGFSLERNAP